MKNDSKLISISVFIVQILIFGVPLAICFLLLSLLSSVVFRLLLIILSPALFAILFVLVAGIISLPFQKAIIKGVFPRKTSNPIYAARKMYGTCWNTVFYCKPVYHFFLNTNALRKLMFRLFGYKGSLNFTLAPDAWIRDLPLLIFEDGVYIGNRATLGTNVCLADGNIMVHKVEVKKGSMIGHLSVIGLGFRAGENTEIEVGCQIGVHVKIGNNTVIRSRTGVSHGVKIGDNVDTGLRTYIGNKAVIGNNIKLPNDCSIPDNVVVETQADVLKYARYPLEG